MPRRPLFCHVCTDLLDQLTAAAEAVASDGSSVAGTTGTNGPHAALETSTQKRSRYFELKARVHQHREAAHTHGSQFRCVSQALW
jgi:hypothetical protein